MLDYGIAENTRKERLNSIKLTLNKATELIAFIRVYGSQYSQHYNSYIIIINNMSERFLKDLNSCDIDNLYNVYYNAKKENENDNIEILKKLRLVIESLPSSISDEVYYRTSMYQKKR